jgi:hypothetical protein
MPIRRRNASRKFDPPALEAARARIRAAGRGGDPVEIEHAARAYAAEVRREGLAGAARRCAAALKAVARRLGGLAPPAPRGRRGA